MATSHNGHGTFADESWQGMFLNNAGFQIDNITAECYRSLDEDIIKSLKSFRETHRLPPDIIATITDERGIESHCRRSGHKRSGHKRSGHSEKTPWSVEEVPKLIVGVISTTPPGQQKRWQEIVKKYFKGERTEEKLKQKWKELKKHATKKTDGEQWLFYMMAAIVEVDIQHKTEVFENVVKESCVTLERTTLILEACNWLKSAKNMELKQQLNKIKEYVTDAERNHVYAQIPYWSSQVHP